MGDDVAQHAAQPDGHLHRLVLQPLRVARDPRRTVLRLHRPQRAEQPRVLRRALDCLAADRLLHLVHGRGVALALGAFVGAARLRAGALHLVRHVARAVQQRVHERGVVGEFPRERGGVEETGARADVGTGVDGAPLEGSGGAVVEVDVLEEEEVADDVRALDHVDQLVVHHALVVQQLLHLHQDAPLLLLAVGVAQEAQEVVRLLRRAALAALREGLQRRFLLQRPLQRHLVPVLETVLRDGIVLALLRTVGEGVQNRLLRGLVVFREGQRLGEGEDEIANGELAPLAENLVNHLLLLRVGELRREAVARLPSQLAVHENEDGVAFARNGMVGGLAHVAEEIPQLPDDLVGIDDADARQVDIDVARRVFHKAVQVELNGRIHLHNVIVDSVLDVASSVLLDAVLVDVQEALHLKHVQLADNSVLDGAKVLRVLVKADEEQVHVNLQNHAIDGRERIRLRLAEALCE